MQKGIDYIGVGVGAVIFDSNGKVLLAQRGPQANNETGKWEFPGGSVEFGDTLIETIKREMREEHGIEIEILSLLGVCDHILTDEKQHWVSPSFVARHVAGVPKIMEPKKCSAIRWVELSEINIDDITEATKHDLHTYITRHGYTAPANSKI
ncbi:MAG: NUDIX domain-containing protein [bacterium]|nr:NUDIX domain-containing protein [bacterium]